MVAVDRLANVYELPTRRELDLDRRDVRALEQLDEASDEFPALRSGAVGPVAGQVLAPALFDISLLDFLVPG